MWILSNKHPHRNIQSNMGPHSWTLWPSPSWPIKLTIACRRCPCLFRPLLWVLYDLQPNAIPSWYKMRPWHCAQGNVIFRMSGCKTSFAYFLTDLDDGMRPDRRGTQEPVRCLTPHDFLPIAALRRTHSSCLWPPWWRARISVKTDLPVFSV